MMQMSPHRIKRAITWWTDDYGILITEEGTRRKVPANHARGRYYNPMNRKRSMGQKPRKRLRRAA